MTPDGCYGDPRNNRQRDVRPVVDEAGTAALQSPGMDAGGESQGGRDRMKYHAINGSIQDEQG